ncbi:MAG: FAD-dependent oxidoreductase [Chloroflexi bacterium]|nr:FAD-dependent oxidoreductase [Chloroflexota bacterium]MYD16688.1 FAD-dependent oxidoreductase [Chloroflexota bacterium]
MAELKVYGAPWCPDCRRSKAFLSEHRVDYEWIDIDQDPDALTYVEELQNGGRSIPTIILPDGGMLIEPSDEELAQALGTQVRPQREFYDLAIIGGGPAGLAASIYAAREGIDTVVIERSALGGQAGLTNRIDNYPGFPDGVDGDDLMARFVAQARRFGVELLSAVGAVELTASSDVEVTLSSGDRVAAHAAILTPGSTYRRLDVPGEQELIGSSVHFCSTCDGPFYAGAKQLAVIGGGNSALEEGLYLTQFADQVHIIHRGDQLSGSFVLQDKVRSHPRVQLSLNTSVQSMEGESKLSTLTLQSNGGITRTSPDGVFVFIGLQPNTGFLEGVVDLDERGFIRTDQRFQTSIPAVYAAGDARAGSTKQLGAAVGEGITALMMTREYLRAHQHVRTPSVEMD